MINRSADIKCVGAVKYAKSRLVIGASLLVAAMSAPAAFADELDRLVLVHKFSMKVDGSLTSVVLKLLPEEWTVDSTDGRVATARELRAVLKNLTMVMFGGASRCAVDGNVQYPCGFALAALDFAGLASDEFSANRSAWISTSSTTLLATTENPGSPGSLIVFDERLKSALSTARDDQPSVVGMFAPERYLGDKSQAYGKVISFRFSTVDNPIVPGTFLANSGIVMLSNDPLKRMQQEPPNKGDQFWNRRNRRPLNRSSAT